MKRLLITLLLSFLAVAAVMAWRWGPTLFPSSEVSDLYRRYEHNPHIRATDIRNFQVNDTLRVDVTLLQADNDSAWCALMLDFGESEDLINLYNTNRELFVGEDVNAIEIFYIDKDDTKKHLPRLVPGSRLVIGSYEKKTLCIFHAEEEKYKDIISLTQIQNLKR